MRILLAENMDRRLNQHFDSDFYVVTVSERGRSGKKNGELLQATSGEFDALVTMDQPAVNSVLRTIEPGQVLGVPA